MVSRETSVAPKPSLGDQIAAVERELVFRERMYPQWVVTRKGGMTPGKAKHEIDCMREALYTLKKLKLTQAIGGGFDH